MIANFQWSLSKPEIHICSPHRFVEGSGKVDGFFISPVVINILIGFKAFPQVIQVLSCVGKCSPKGSLVTHHQTQHEVAKGGLGSEGVRADRGNNPRTYSMAFPERAGPRPCPVKGCSGRASTQTAMRVNFWHRHVRDTVVVLEEGNLPHPRCPLCDIMVPWKALNGTHWCMAQCTQGALVHGTVHPGSGAEETAISGG